MIIAKIELPLWRNEYKELLDAILKLDFAVNKGIIEKKGNGKDKPYYTEPEDITKKDYNWDYYRTLEGTIK